jgi:hypothetical protein
MSDDRRLPVFEAGKDLQDQLRAKKLNDFVQFVKELTPVAGTGIKISRTANGSIYSAKLNSNDRGTYANPYEMGSCFYASNPSFVSSGGEYTGAGGTAGQWGGISDSGFTGSFIIPLGAHTGFDFTDIKPDTYNRDRIPRLAVSGSPIAEGVKITLQEETWTGFYTYSVVSPGVRTLINSRTSLAAAAPDGTQYEEYAQQRRVLTFDADGCIADIGSTEVEIWNPYHDNSYAYSMGTAVYAGSTSAGNPGGVVGFWGGARDLSGAYCSTTSIYTAGTGSYIDVFDRDKPLQHPTRSTVTSNTSAHGVRGYPVRVATQGMGTAGPALFTREMAFDVRGGIYYWGPEVKVDLGAVSGIGGGGNLPLNIYSATSGAVTGFISAYSGTFGGNTEVAPGSAVPTITDGGVAVRIDAATPPKLTIPSGSILCFLQVNVTSAGAVSNCFYAVTSGINPPANTTGTLYVRIANLTVAGAVVTVSNPQNVRGSQTYELCGGDEHLYALS